MANGELLATLVESGSSAEGSMLVLMWFLRQPMVVQILKRQNMPVNGLWM